MDKWSILPRYRVLGSRTSELKMIAAFRLNRNGQRIKVHVPIVHFVSIWYFQERHNERT